MRLFPLLIFALFVSVLLMQQQNIQAMQVSKNVQQSNAYAAYFLAYRSGVMAYMQSNPSFTGSIPASAVSAVNGQQYPAAFLAAAGNAIIVSGSGRQVTVYAALPTGTLGVLLNQSNNDASIGISAGTTWTTQANGVVTNPQPLATPVPINDIVSVFIM